MASLSPCSAFAAGTCVPRRSMHALQSRSEIPRLAVHKLLPHKEFLIRTRAQDEGEAATTRTTANGKRPMGGAQLLQRAADAAGVSLGPIGLTVGSDLKEASSSSEDETNQPIESIATMSTKEWREKFEKDGRVDLWVEEEFNAASRLVGGRAVHFGGHAGHLSGEGKGKSNVPTHKVKITNPACSQELEVEVPEDRYILWEAEDQGLVLPYACRMGCCTACAVKVKSGELYQPQSLGVSKELRERGYGLMCVGFPLSDLELELCPDDLVYDEQFGKFFESQATNPDAVSVSRDDFAIELALGDE